MSATARPAAPAAPRIAPTIAHPSGRNEAPILTVGRVSFWYGEAKALREVSLEIYPRGVIAFMGPSGCGKTTLLECFNRMQDSVRDARLEGEIRLHGEDL